MRYKTEATEKFLQSIQGLYSLSRRASNGKISWSLEAAKLDITLIASLKNLEGISTALLGSPVKFQMDWKV